MPDACRYYLIFPKSFLFTSLEEIGIWRVHNMCKFDTPYHLPREFLDKATLIIRVEPLESGINYRWVIKDSKKRKGTLTPTELASPKIQFLIGFGLEPMRVFNEVKFI